MHKALHKDSGFILAIKIVDIDINNDEATSLKREIDILKVCVVDCCHYLCSHSQLYIIICRGVRVIVL